MITMAGNPHSWEALRLAPLPSNPFVLTRERGLADLPRPRGLRRAEPSLLASLTCSPWQVRDHQESRLTAGVANIRTAFFGSCPAAAVSVPPTLRSPGHISAVLGLTSSRPGWLCHDVPGGDRGVGPSGGPVWTSLFPKTHVILAVHSRLSLVVF